MTIVFKIIPARQTVGINMQILWCVIYLNVKKDLCWVFDSNI